MTKLLTEQELEDAIESLGETTKEWESLKNQVITLIQSQKQAHAGMVIGTHQECSDHHTAEYPENCPGCAVVEYESEQRARNKT